VDSDPKNPLSHAQGCLLGQIAGDSLGSLVEFETEQFFSIDRKV
jgi:hypothetical protein